MTDRETQLLTNLVAEIKTLYQKNDQKLLFHGWHHINFVHKKAIELASPIKANLFLVESSAWTHDLNYIVEVNSNPDVAKQMRGELLNKLGYSVEEIDRIESIIDEAHTGWRGEEISKEGMALSDADTLFKSLPITPILFASRFISQNKINISKLAEKITSEQNSLMEKDIYFYTKLAKEKYLNWAKINLELWNNVIECLDEKDIREMLIQAGFEI